MRNSERETSMASCSGRRDSEDKLSRPTLPKGGDLDLLIVGKAGHGKSATANSILGKDIFTTGSDTTPVTTDVGVFMKEIDGRKLVVVDTPSHCDTGTMKTEEIREKAKQDFSIAVSLSVEGFHAILIVFKYGDKMTKEEIDAIQEMKSLLGQDFIRNHGVLLMTFGDNFERHTIEKKSFQTWCEEQKGYFPEVLNECQHRCLLFNNRDESGWNQQRFELVKMIDGMKGCRRDKDGIFMTIEDRFRADTYKPSEAFVLFNMLNLKKKEEDDRAFAYDMRTKLRKLRDCTTNLKGDVKETIEAKITTALNQLDKMEEKKPNQYDRL